MTPPSAATTTSNPTWADVNRDVIRTVSMPGDRYFAWMCLIGLTLGAGVAAWAWQIWIGMGAAGKRSPQMWAMYITTFVFWIGIGHAGTLISAVLYLFRAKWRTSIYRGAEAMTVFAVMTAGLFPLIHAGRMWFAYWLMPYPNQRYLWPNFKSPLVWDVFAISTYLTISVVFFLVGLVPDIAALRDQATGIRKQIYTIMSLGWEGSDSQWRHYRRAYGIFAAISTPLVLSVHSVVSFDFAMALVPGWHSTLFPPFFVAGAILSGFAMVLVLIIPARRVFRLHNVITPRHFDAMAKMLLITSWIVTYSYLVEIFMGWYSADRYETYQYLHNRPFGWYGWAFWLMMFCNCVATQLFWSRRMRRNLTALFAVALLVNLGMWLERFEIIVVSLARDFLPSAWHLFVPTWVDLGILTGTLGFFGLLFLLFLRVVPFVPVAEMKQMRSELDAHAGAREEAAR